MKKNETYLGLAHGTIKKYADKIIKSGFEYSEDGWFGYGVYFYDNKSKAWWSANRTARKHEVNKNESILVFADIIKLNVDYILDLRIKKEIKKLKEFTDDLFKNNSVHFDDTNKKRSAVLSFFLEKVNNIKLVISAVKREDDEIKNENSFIDSLGMLYNFETIYCVKDKSIIENVRKEQMA